MQFLERKTSREISLMRDVSKFRTGVHWTSPFERNVIFPTVLIARDVISNSRQSAEIYRRYLTWFRFIVHRVVRRGVICDHNFPLNVTLDAWAEACLFFFSFLLPTPPCSTHFSPSDIPHCLPSPRTVTIYEHIFRVPRSKPCPKSIPERRRPNGVPRFNLRFYAIIESTRSALMFLFPEIRGSMPPIINEKLVYMSARLKDTVVIPCVAYANPTPTNR